MAGEMVRRQDQRGREGRPSQVHDHLRIPRFDRLPSRRPHARLHLRRWDRPIQADVRIQRTVPPGHPCHRQRGHLARQPHQGPRSQDRRLPARQRLPGGHDIPLDGTDGRCELLQRGISEPVLAPLRLPGRLAAVHQHHQPRLRALHPVAVPQATRCRTADPEALLRPCLRGVRAGGHRCVRDGPLQGRQRRDHRVYSSQVQVRRPLPCRSHPASRDGVRADQLLGEPRDRVCKSAPRR